MRFVWLLLLLSSCMVGPNYVSPEITITDSWVEVVDGEEITSDWWSVFNEPLLTQYIEKAVSYNKEVLAAEANILQAIAMRQVAASSLFPQIGADLNATKTYFSKNGPVFAIGPAVGNLPGAVSNATGLPFAAQVPQIQNLFNALFDISWQIDLFGKTRREVEAAKATIGSTIEEKNGILLTVMAEIATNYMQLRISQMQALLTEEKIGVLENKGAILIESLKAGYINQLDYENIQIAIANAKAELPQYIAAAYQHIYAISVLTGEPPENLLSELLPFKDLPSLPDKVAVGIRSDLLRRRPDVRFAERKLAAATANIGVAVASFFPTMTLFADGGFQSLQVNRLFNWQSRTWDYGGDLMTPIYQGGLLFGNLHASQAAKTMAAANYEQTVLTALQEAEQYLMSYNQDLKVVENLQEALNRNEVLLFLSKERFELGLINQLNYFDTSLQCIAAKQSLLANQGVTLSDLVLLYKALGGGWENP